MKEKKYKPILSTADKKIVKQNRVKSVIIALICISVVFNIIFIADIKIPIINPDGGSRKVVVDVKKEPSIFNQVLKDNSKFETFTSINLETANGTYYFSKMNKVCRLYGVEGWDFEYCDFEMSKWEEIKNIVLKYQLKEYDPNNHVDSEGRIQNYEEDYTLELTIDGKTRKMEVPENVGEIEDYLIKITDLARTK